jgi:hypothetical protein
MVYRVRELFPGHRDYLDVPYGIVDEGAVLAYASISATVR